MPRRAIVGALVLSALAAPSSVRAQKAHRVTLHDQIDTLFTFGPCGGHLCLSDVNTTHGGHFDSSAVKAGNALIAFVASFIGLRVSNTPISSSSGGVTFTFEEGVPVQTSTSAGPIFAERAQTLGRNRAFVGLDFTQLTFRDLRGVPLHGLVFNYAHSDGGNGILGDSPDELDFVSVKMALDLNLLVASVSFTYGLVDGVDLGVTVPFVHLSLQGHSVAQIVTSDSLHYFESPTASSRVTAVSSANGTAMGIGDVEGHVKINIAQSERLGAALFVSARIPTGDTANFLGSGAFSGRGLGILSARFGNFNPHLNLGFVLRDESKQYNSVAAALGFDELLSPQATMAIDVLSDWQIGAAPLQPPPPVVYQAPAPRTMDVTNIPNQGDDLVSLTVGFKFQTRRGFQVVTSALIPLRNSGLQPTLAWTGGVEYNF